MEVCRSTVAFVLVLSAAWKLRNRAGFVLALRATFGNRLAAVDDLLSRFIPCAEVGVATLMMTPGQMGEVGAALGLASMVIFSVVLLLNRDPRHGCGCWRAPESGSRFSFLARNALLVLLAVGGVVLQPEALPMANRIFLLGSGLLVALVILEVPTIVAVASLETRGRTGA